MSCPSASSSYVLHYLTSLVKSPYYNYLCHEVLEVKTCWFGFFCFVFSYEVP